MVNNITGLTDFHLKPRAVRRQASTNSVDPNYTLTLASGTIAHFMAPGDFQTIYDLNPLLTNGTNGTGVKIAVMGQVDISLSDVAAFRTASGLTANVPTIHTYGTDPGSPSTACLSSNPPNSCTPSAGDLDEAQLDVEWSGAVAPSATIIYANSTNVIDTSLVQAVDNKLAPIMTVSYGNCEIAFSDGERNSLNVLFEQANAQGITIFGAAGDSGATDCDNGVSSAVYGLQVDFPASSPFVTGLGGTSFSGDLTSTSYWSTTNSGTPVSSALSYIPETIWNETTADLTRTNPSFGSGGGGTSLYFTKPAWQTGTGVPNDSSRDVPDVSLNSAASHDGYFVCAEGSCTNGTYFNTTPAVGTTPASTSADVFGGTSVATPAFAGILALVEQKIGATSGLGNINPTLYSLGNSTYVNSVFHDVTTGNNNSPCTSGTANCPNGGSIGYNAGLGYDLASGWGSVDVANLANDWKLVSAIGVGAGIPQNISTTTLTLPSTNLFAGATLNVNVTVGSGTTASTATPTGSVTVFVDNVAVGSATPLSNGTATYALATTGLTTGTHTLGASYSGDSVYIGSKGSTTLGIAKYFMLSPSGSPTAATATATAGSSAPAITFTVTPASGFVGSVAFTASALSSLTASAQFSATPLTIASSTTSATTTLTLSAFVTNAKGGLINVASSSPAARPASTKGSLPPWYAVGSGSMLAGLFLVVAPLRRPRWGALLALVLSVGMIGVSGCSSSSSSTTPVTTPTTGTQTNTVRGSYGILVTATGTTSGGATEVQTAIVNFVVQ